MYLLEKTKKNSEPELYERFMETHNCPINHEGSAGSMEAAGLVECFMNSIENRKLRYTHYIGDCDSKAYNELVTVMDALYQNNVSTVFGFVGMT